MPVLQLSVHGTLVIMAVPALEIKKLLNMIPLVFLSCASIENGNKEKDITIKPCSINFY
jgi:hypothetical protein